MKKHIRRIAMGCGTLLGAYSYWLLFNGYHGMELLPSTVGVYAAIIVCWWCASDGRV